MTHFASLPRAVICAVVAVAGSFAGVSCERVPPRADMARVAARMEKDGTVHVPAFDLPLSAYLSEETRAEFQKWSGEELAVVREAYKACPPLDEAAPENWPAIRKCQAEFFYTTPFYKNLRQRYPVAMLPEEIGGVPVEIFVPADGIARRNIDRVLINLHGGGFFFGPRLSSHLESIPIASLGKIKVISVDYRLAPLHRFPAATEDVAAVYRELLKSHEPQKIGFYGCSAGGPLIAQSIAWFLKYQVPLPGAVGMFCYGAERASARDKITVVRSDGARLGGIISGIDIKKYAQYTPFYYRGVDITDPLVSPGNHDDVMAKFPPSLLLSGSRDYLLSAALVTHAQLVRLRVPTELHVWEGMYHCFFYDPDFPESREAYDVILRFFDRYLGK